ncbi:MAG: Gfo/Idh/MocA family oxidoreductase [Polyangiaceae bacterium]
MSIGFALLGTGKITDHLAPALRRAEGAELVAVLSRDAERAEAFIGRHEATEAKAYTDLDKLLDDPRVDAVIVATPDGLHMEHAHASLARGKHVLVEKPMTTSTSDAEVLVYVAAHANLRLGVGYHLRHHAGHKALRERIANGSLGTIRHGRIQWTWKAKEDENWRAKGELGRWWTLAAVGTHAIDLARWLLTPLGEPQLVHATLVAPRWGGREEIACFSLGFREGALVEIFVSNLFASPRRLEICGDEAAAIGEGTLGPKGGGTILIDAEPLAYEPVDPYQAEIEDFVAAIRDGRPPLAPGEDGLVNVRYLDEISS